MSTPTSAPSFRNQRQYSNVTNEQLLLIDILNRMYNDNLRQVQNLQTSNTLIMNLLIQILNRESPSTTAHRGTTTTINIPMEEMTIPAGLLSRLTGGTRGEAEDEDSESETLLFETFLEPVVVYPTAAQIESATRNTEYRDLSGNTQTHCPINQEAFAPETVVSIIRSCGHMFERSALMTWFQSHCHCPICRYDIREYRSPNVPPPVDISGNLLPPQRSSQTSAAMVQLLTAIAANRGGEGTNPNNRCNNQ